MFSTTYSNFFLRCGNCKADEGNDRFFIADLIAGVESIKKVGVAQVRVSTTSELTPVQVPDFYVQCQVTSCFVVTK